MHYGVGGRISGIKIGIVNNEVVSMNECSNKTLTTPTINGFNCDLRKSSCRFLDELDPEYVEKVSDQSKPFVKPVVYVVEFFAFTKYFCFLGVLQKL